jgi:hypothetical protein
MKGLLPQGEYQAACEMSLGAKGLQLFCMTRLPGWIKHSTMQSRAQMLLQAPCIGLILEPEASHSGP